LLDTIVSAIGLALAKSGVGWIVRHLQVSRNFEVLFGDTSSEWLPLQATEYNYSKNIQVETYSDGRDIPICYVCVRARQASTVDTLVFRAVRRGTTANPFRPYLWSSITPVTIECVWDAEFERQQRQRQAGLGGSPVIKHPDRVSDGDGGVRAHFNPVRSLLEGQRLWLRICIRSEEPFEGFLEVQGPTKDGRPSYARRPLVITPRLPDTQHESIE